MEDGCGDVWDIANFEQIIDRITDLVLDYPIDGNDIFVTGEHQRLQVKS